VITINQAAYRVGNSASKQKDEEVFVSTAMIPIICSVLSTIFSGIRMWCEWRNNQKIDGQTIKETCARRPYRIRRQIHRVVREKLGEIKYRKHGSELVNAILNAGTHASPAELEHVINQYDYVNRWGEREQEL